MATSSSPRSVLVMRLSALGDVAITIPVLYSVCEAHRDTQFVMLTRQWAAQLFVNPPTNLVIRGVELSHYKGVWGMVRLARQLHREYGFDTMADLHSVLRSWIIGTTLCLHGVRVARIDKSRRDKRRLIKGKMRKQLTTTHERYANVFKQLGLDFDETFEGFTQCRTEVLPTKHEGEKWVAIAPFSQHSGKEYPLDKIEEVAVKLLADKAVRIILFGGGTKERKQLAAVAHRHERITSLADIQHDFNDEYGILSQCDVMVSMDSANAHLASLTRTPVVSVWGATHPWCGFMGWRQDSANAIQLDLPCRPCSVFGNKDCRYGDYHCMNDIAPDMIVERVKSLL